MLHLNNLNWWITDSLIEETFSKFGSIQKILFNENKENGLSLGQAIVIFEKADNALAAFKALGERKLSFTPGKSVTISFTNSDVMHSWITHGQGRKERIIIQNQKLMVMMMNNQQQQSIGGDGDRGQSSERTPYDNRSSTKSIQNHPHNQLQPSHSQYSTSASTANGRQSCSTYFTAIT